MSSLLKERRTRIRKTQPREIPSPSNLLTYLCEVMGVSRERVTGSCRLKHLVKARAIYSCFGRELGFTLKEIATELNHHHATVLHHHKLYESYLEEGQPWFRQEVKDEMDGLRFRLRTKLRFTPQI